MKAIEYKASDLQLINEFNKLKDHSQEEWSDNKYSTVKKSIKDHYLREQNFTCPFCQQRIVVTHNASWDTEHIISKKKYRQFMFEPKNLCVTCKDCNLEKSDKNVLTKQTVTYFPKTSKAYIIVHPHFDQYKDHITVLKPGKSYRYKTEKGRKTIQIYGLDRFHKDANRDKVPDPIMALAEELIYCEHEEEQEKIKSRLAAAVIAERKNNIKDNNGLAFDVIANLLLSN